MWVDGGLCETSETVPCLVNGWPLVMVLHSHLGIRRGHGTSFDASVSVDSCLRGRPCRVGASVAPARPASSKGFEVGRDRALPTLRPRESVGVAVSTAPW